MEKFDYTVETSKDFDEAVTAVEEKAKEKGFGVLHIHDIKATLANKGFDWEPLKIVEICNAKYANQALSNLYPFYTSSVNSENRKHFLVCNNPP